MSVLTNNLTFDLVAILATVVIGVIAAIKWRFNYWSKIGVPYLNPTIPFGDARNLILGKVSFGEYFLNLYNVFKSKGHKIGGIFIGTQPHVVVTDLEIIKNIMQKDFGHFMNHGFYVNEEHDPLNSNLFNLEDQKWRDMRVKLTPTFTSGKMKMMFQTFVDCTVGLNDMMKTFVKNNEPVDIKEVLARFTTDIIGSAAFGLECNSLKDPNSEFRKHGRDIFTVTFMDRIKVTATFSLPHSILNLLRLKITKTSVETFFMKVVRDTVQYRETNNIYRKDFMHLLLQLKNRGKIADDEKISDGSSNKEGLTMNELAAQAFVFFLAGFETSSTTMTWALYELALNQEIQEKLREEINSVLENNNGKMTYDGIMSMSYLDGVINETLRKHPAIPTLQRVCNKDYVVPNTSIKIEKGVNISIPTWGIHKDPEYYPDPEKFDPDRFSEENKKTRPSFTFLPFGEGPRLCIGLRFGVLQSKVGLCTLVRNYKLTLSSKTKVPLELNPLDFFPTAKGGIWLDVEKIQ